MATRVYTPPSTMERLLKAAPPLAILGFLLLVPAITLIIPSEEYLAVLLYLVLVTVALLLLYQRGIKLVDPTFPASLFVLAFLAKLMGSLLRYWTVVDLYDLAADAPGYHEQGIYVAEYLRRFDFSVLSWHQWRGDAATALSHITGIVYAFLPNSMAGAFFLFASLAFAGSVFFYLALYVARPDGRIGLYRLLIFFIPSILFWPSSLGKDAWLFFNAGLATWGWISFARRGRITGLVMVAVGLLLISPVRPHIAALLAISMAAAYLLYGVRGQRSVFSWMIGAIVVGTLVVFLVNSGADFFALDDVSPSSLGSFYEDVQLRTFTGGSRFTTYSVSNPITAVIGIGSALVRPLPWEARNGQALVASLETMVWLLFCWTQRRVFLRNIRNFRSDPVTSFAFFFSFGWLLALTAIGNFGILARQRVVMLPFLWMLFV